MFTKTFATIGFLALLVVAPAFSQTQLQATIPFDFTAGVTRMAAGEYTVTVVAPSIVKIASLDHKAACMVATFGVGGWKVATEGTLVFNRYGNSYFLSQVWRPGYDLGRQLIKSGREREHARNIGAGQLASVRVLSR